VGLSALASLDARLVARPAMEQLVAEVDETALRSGRELDVELKLGRARGFVTNFGESESDVAAVAVAIEGQPGNRRASITVSAPIGRLSQDRVGTIADAARACAVEIRRLSAPVLDRSA
jgi:DNA-binding IclR family transcriptional regulator